MGELLEPVGLQGLERGLVQSHAIETEAIHVMFYIEVYVVARCIASTTPAKTRETYCVQGIHRTTCPRWWVSFGNEDNMILIIVE